MSNKKISELDLLTSLDSTEQLAIVDGNQTKRITVATLLTQGLTSVDSASVSSAKISYVAGGIATAAIADSAITTVKLGDAQVSAAKISNNAIVVVQSSLPTSGQYTGQLALTIDDNKLYVWNGTQWINSVAPGSINAFTDTTSGIINIATTVSSGTATITASIDDTGSAAQFLAGPVGSGGTVGYRTIDGGDLPTATTTSKGGVIVNGGGLTISTDTIQIDNSVTPSSTKHLVTYDANGLISGGSVITSSDVPVATTSAKGAVIASDGLAVDANGNLSIDNTVTAGTYTKVTVTSKGVVSAGDVLTAADIPDHSAAKLTSGTIDSSRIASDAITAEKLADQSTVKFGGALGSDNVTIFPDGDFKGQLFWDETSLDLYVYTGSAFIPITVLSGNLVNAGTYNANTNLVSSVTTAGSSAGFAAGSALPAPVGANLNHYVVVETSGTGSGAAPAVALAPPDMLLSNGVGTEYRLIDVSNAIAGQTAANISFIASGTITATDVQAALQEVDTEKLAKAGGTMTGDLNLGTSTNVVFEGSSADDFETTLTVTDPTADRTITLPNVTGTVVTTGDTGSVTSTMITDGTIVNADINASAEIAVSKLANGTARQLLQTDSGGTSVEFTSNVDVPGTLDVTSAATFDSTVAATGLLSANGNLAYPAGSAAAVSLYSGSDTDTGIYSPGSDQFGIATAGTPRIVVDATGKVAIGATSPLYALDVRTSGTNDGQLKVGGSSTATGLLLEQTNSGSTTANIQNSYYATSASASLSIKSGFTTFHTGTAGDERLRIDSSGNVGISESSPERSLHVNSGVIDTVAKFESSDSAAIINFVDSGDANGVSIGAVGGNMTFRSGLSTERLQINSDGTSTFAGAVVVNRSSATGDSTLLNTKDGNNVFLVTPNAAYIYDGTGNATSDRSIVLSRNGSAEFAGPVEVKQNLASTFGTEAFVVSNASQDQVIRLNNNGSASFANTVSVQDPDTSDAAAVGSAVHGGLLIVKRESTAGSDKNVFQGYKGTTQTSSIGADGSADFAGRGDFGSSSHNTTHAVQAQNNKSDRSTVLAIQHNSSGPVFEGRNGAVSTTAATSTINADGSADFAGNVTSSGSFGSDRTSGSLVNFIGRLNGSTTSLIKADGSAQFTQGASDLSGGAALKATGTAYGTNKAIHAYINSSNSARSLIFAENALGTVFNVKADGEVFFEGSVKGKDWDSSTGTGTGYFLGNAGNIRVRRASTEADSATLFAGYKGTGTPVVNITADGSATFAGNISAGRGIFRNSSNSSLIVGVDNINDANYSAIQLKPDGNITTTGTVGINVTPSGSSKLQVGGSMRFASSGAANDSTNPVIYRVSGEDSLAFASGNSERMRITDQGEVCMGPSNVGVSSSYAHSVKITAAGGGSIYVNNGTGTQTAVAFVNSSVSAIGSIVTTNTSTTYNTSSDYRLKENVVDLTDAIPRLKTLPVHRFNFISDTETTVDGFLAHEAQLVVPESVTGEKDGEEMQSIDLSKLVPLLTAALKESIVEIEKLKKRVEDLES